jgi:uncharacterized caspase-like protein
MSTLFNSGHALLVGVGNDLPITVKDAEVMHTLLSDPDRAAYPQKQINYLAEKDATREKILAAFDHLAQTADEDSTVIIYYSGHGGVIEDSGQFFLVPNNFDRDNYKNTWIKAEEFTEKVEAIKSRKKIVLLDCCHASGMSKDGPKIGEADPTIGFQKRISDFTSILDRGSGSIIFSSSRDDEYSYIMPGDDNSLFTLCFKEAIEGGANKGEEDDGFRILDILSYIFSQVPTRSKEKQHPYINKITDLSDNFVLCMPPLKMRGKSASANKPAESRLAVLVQMEIDGMVETMKLNAEKLNYLKSQLEIQVDPSMKFMLEKQILEVAARQGEHKERIQKLSSEL